MVRQRDAILKVLAGESRACVQETGAGADERRAERNVEVGVKNEWRGYGERKGVMEWAKEVATAEQRIEEVGASLPSSRVEGAGKLIRPSRLYEREAGAVHRGTRVA